jgi:nitrogen fixation/metabolism regulation signal transduction histidine kinase
MVSNRNFRLNVIFRIAAILVSGYAALYVATQTHFWLVSFWLGLLMIALLISLVSYVERSDRELAHFLLSISQNDFSSTYPPGKKGHENRLHDAFRQLMAVYGKLREERETHHQYLQTVVEHIRLGLVAAEETGEVRLMNQAAKNLFRKPFLHHLNNLSLLDQTLPQTLMDLPSGDRLLRKVVVEGSLMHLSIQATRFKLHQKGYVLFSFQDIRSELEAQEVESWQKLIRVLTHEIMNSAIPISTLSSMVSEMLEDENGQLTTLAGMDEENLADLHGSLRTIESRSQGLVHFVQAYKSLTQMPRPKLESVSVRLLLERVSLLANSTLGTRGIRLYIQPPGADLFIQADVGMIEQILLNLIGNAADAVAGMKSPLISLSAEKHGDQLQIIVADNGIGMSQEVQEQIFIPFYTTKQSGTGIGLSLSKQIMLGHGGKILVQSEPGKGSKFVLAF